MPELGAGLDRRTFIQNLSAGSAGLVVAFAWFREGEHVLAGTADAFAPNVYLEVATDGVVTLWCVRSEMGQGVRTALPMILADELGADWRHVRVEQAAMSPRFAGVRLRTSGSGSAAGTWLPLRQAGAAAREMLCRAAALRWKVPLEDCVTELGNVRHRASNRQATFGSLASEAATLDVPSTPALKPSSAFTLIGTRVARIDGPAIVRGDARYGLDVRVPGMRFAALARAPHFGARARRWSDVRARAIHGVTAVVPVTTGIATGVAVVADSTWAAFKGRDALEIEWSQGASQDFDSRAFMRQLDAAAAASDGFESRHEGDARAAIAAAPHRLDVTYRSPFQAHACLEPMNCTADVKTDRCELWVPTQAPEVAQELAARLLGLPLTAVTVNIPLLGGGFGRRLFCDYVPEAVEISRAVRAPVQVVWSREEDLAFGFFQPAESHRVTVGWGADGRIVGWTHKVAGSLLSMYAPHDLSNPLQFAQGGSPWGAFDNPYRLPALRVDFVPVESPVPSGPWRAVEYPGSVFARESALDEVAAALGKDPLALRLELLEPFDRVRVGDQTIDRARLRRVLELATDRAGWGGPLRAVGNALGRRMGRGLACNVYHGSTHVAQVAEVSVGAAGDIRVHRVVCAVDCGQPINLAGIEGQVESGILWGLSATTHGSVSFRQGRAEQRSFSDFRIVRFGESPAIDVHVVPSGERPHGLGEQAVAPVAAAVANAVYAATGVRARELPLTGRG